MLDFVILYLSSQQRHSPASVLARSVTCSGAIVDFPGCILIKQRVIQPGATAILKGSLGNIAGIKPQKNATQPNGTITIQVSSIHF